MPLPAHLLPDREIHIIISVLSGRQKAQEYFDESLKPLLDEHEVLYSVHATTSAQSIVELTRSVFLFNACKGVKQTIILLSGDGGTVDIVNTLTSVLMRNAYDSRPPSIFFKPVVALIPMGTANALAWSAGLAQDPLKALMGGRARSLPSFEVRASPGTKLVTDEGRGRQDLAGLGDDEEVTLYGAVVFSWGIHASLVAMSDTSEYRKHGLERFKMAAEELMKNPHEYHGTVKYRTERDGEWKTLFSSNDKNESQKDQHTYVLATLVSNLEEHFRISPASSPLDGSMHLVAIGPQPPQEIMRVLGLAYQGGRHTEDAIVTYEQIENVRIEFHEDDQQWRLVCVDGKILAVEEGGWVEVRRLPGFGVDGRRVVELVC